MKNIKQAKMVKSLVVNHRVIKTMFLGNQQSIISETSYDSTMNIAKVHLRNLPSFRSGENVWEQVVCCKQPENNL